MDANCKQCGQDLVDGGRPVGAWRFCETCFEGLLAPKVVEPEPQVQEDVAAAPPIEPKLPGPGLRTSVSVGPVPEERDAPSDGSRCRVCGGELGEDGARLSATIGLCAGCLGTFRSAAATVSSADDTPDVPDEPVGLIEPPGVRAAQCTGCGRAVAAAGSRTVGSDPYCPDCYYALDESVRAAAESAASMPDEPVAPAASDAPDACDDVDADEATTPSVVAEPTGFTCDACERLTPGPEFTRVNGFRLCGACVATDRVGAADLAHARHRARLNALRAELGG